MEDIEIRELRYFAAVAEELHFGRAAERLQMSQPPLSRAIQQLEQRLGVELFQRDRRGVRLTAAGQVLLEEARNVFDAATAAVERSRRTVNADDRLVLVTKAGASHELLRDLLDSYAAQPGALPVEVLLCEVGEQRQVLRQGGADAALVHSPYDVFGEFTTQEMLTERQVAIVPRGHPLGLRPHLTMAEVADVPRLPIARWPRHDGSYRLDRGPRCTRSPRSHSWCRWDARCWSSRSRAGRGSGPTMSPCPSWTRRWSRACWRGPRRPGPRDSTASSGQQLGSQTACRSLKVPGLSTA